MEYDMQKFGLTHSYKTSAQNGSVLDCLFYHRNMQIRYYIT